jgi:hypothetical protein
LMIFTQKEVYSKNNVKVYDLKGFKWFYWRLIVRSTQKEQSHRNEQISRFL